LFVFVGFEVLTAVFTSITNIKNALPPSTQWFLARLIFDREDGDDAFLRKVGLHADYKVLYPRCEYQTSMTALSTVCSNLSYRR
jgi:hypothetical protein